MKSLYIFILIVFIPMLNFAQTKEVVPNGVLLLTNSVGESSISLIIELDMEGESIDFDYWIDNPVDMPTVYLQYADQKSNCNIEVRPEASRNSVGFKITGFTESTLDRFLNKDRDNQITLVVKDDIIIKLRGKEGETEPKFWIVPAVVINKMISEDLKFTQDERKQFLTSLNNFYYYENKVDFGVNPGQDSIKTDYVLSVRLQNVYNRKNFLNCNKDSQKKINSVYWNLDTRLSTNFTDSLNYVNFYPVNYTISDFNNKTPYQYKIKVGHESTQSFINKRVVIDTSINLIIPNIINLTTVQSNRLRLKPVISAGLKGYYDYSNNINSFIAGLAHLDAYYYVPVFNNYALIFEGTTFYDFSNERNPNNKIQGNYSITLGAEIPKTGFKAMFKYTDGKTDINFKQGSIISIGLLMDFFQEHKARQISTVNN